MRGDTGLAGASGRESWPDRPRRRLAAPVRSLRATFSRFGPLARPDRAGMAAAAALLALAAASDTVAVLMFMRIVDGVLASGRLAPYWIPAGIWLAAAVAGAAATGLGSYLSARAAERFLLRLRDAVFGHLLRLPPDFFERHPTGDLVARLSGDVEEIESLVSSGVVQAVAAVASVAFFAGAAVWIRWDLALAVLGLLGLLLLTTRGFAGRLRTTAQDERASNGSISDVVQQGVAQVALVQAYGTERHEAGRVHAEGQAWLRARLAQMRLASVYQPLTELFDTLGVIAVVGVGAWDIAGGRLTVGGLVAFATFLGFLYAPVHTLAGLFLTVTTARASSDRLAEMLDTLPTVGEHPGARAEPAREGSVAVSGVTFRYPGAASAALAGVSFEVPPERLVLLTGPSGAGKSTVGRLLLRFYDPTAGRILLDGTDLREYSLAALRSSITLLPQDAGIVEGTVAENIAYGTPGADAAAIAAAARAAQAEEFVSRLPQGYGTPLGASGPRLSGGQRQRIAIARALLRDTPVLVLDEPTTGLDAAATEALLPALRALVRGRSTILISHDLRLARLADEILVIDRGRLVERVTQDEPAHPGARHRWLPGSRRGPFREEVSQR